MTEEISKLDETRRALQRMQQFDVDTLARVEHLGLEMSFESMIVPAKRLVDLYKRLAVNALDDLPNTALDQVKVRANSDFALFNQALEFSSGMTNAPTVRDSIILNTKNAYDQSFQILHPYIAYSLHRSADFQKLDSDARAAMQSILDRGKENDEKMVEREGEANRVLEAIRSVAVEVGVTQQSAHFRQEAAQHEKESEIWRLRTTRFAIALGCYAGISVFFHKIPFIAPGSTYETLQLGISKVLIFSVIAYMLILSARNFLSHKHNAIVNRHRQNALMTHKALIEAAGDHGIREAIMLQAAGCIFSPQSTGYAGDGKGNEGVSPRSVVELLSKSASKNE